MKALLPAAAAIFLVVAFSGNSDATALSLASGNTGKGLPIAGAEVAATSQGVAAGIGVGALGVGSNFVNNRNINIVGVPNVVLYVLGVRNTGTGGGIGTGTGSGGGTGSGTGTGAIGGTSESAAGGGLVTPPVDTVPTDPVVLPLTPDSAIPTDPVVTTPQGGTGPAAFTAAVPEPSTVALLSLGIGGLALAGMRRRK